MTRRHLPILLLGACLLLSAPAPSQARAGGGHGYSGGGRSSSGGGFSSSRSYSSSYGRHRGRGADMPDWMFWPMVLLIVVVLWLQYSGSPSTVLSGGAMRSVPVAQASAARAAAIASLRARDPGFDEDSFLARASAAFLAVQKAWSDQDLRALRRFVSDGVYERFSLQIARMQALGQRNLMEGVEVLGAEVLAYQCDAHFDAACVRVRARATDKTLQGETVIRASGPETFEEVWSFLRRPGAKTLKRPGLIEGACPSCGAPLPIADTAQCGACKSWVNSGEYDWVLAEITQSCEWSAPDPGRDVPGWAALCAADPALNAQVLEDRASAMFWRWLEARRDRNPSPLLGLSLPSLRAEVAAMPAVDYINAAVGGVELVAAESGEGWDRVHLGLRWSASVGGVEGAAADGAERRRHFFVLSRKTRVKTDARGGLRTRRCAACGAPPAKGDEEACGHCGVTLNDGSRDWVLERVVPFGQWRRPNGLTAPAAAALPGLDWGAELSAADATALLAHGMLADGELAVREREYLQAYGRARGVPDEAVERIMAAARSGQLDAPQPADGAQAEAMLRGLARASLADGLVSPDERQALGAFGARFGLAPGDVDALVAEERTALKGVSRTG